MSAYLSYSPWGSIQHRKTIQDGIVVVDTAGHGGIMIRKDVAEQYLSKQARKKGVRYHDYFTYEEDCDYAIPVYELRHLWNKFYKDKTEDEIELSLMKSLSLWNPDYLIAIGVKPLDEQYQIYLDNKREEEMRKNQDPDLIVVAWGSWHTKKEGVVLVGTADGKKHYVTEKSYENRKGLNLLSKCEVIEYDVQESA
jgi:hypothetical protein